jgi:hypothetical protein
MPFGAPGTNLQLSGLLLRADEETISIQLSDHRVIRFRMTDAIDFQNDGKVVPISSFRIGDLVEIDAAVDDRGYLLARVVRFRRSPNPDERTEAWQCPEVRYRSQENLIARGTVIIRDDDRKLSGVEKPGALRDPDFDAVPVLRRRTPGARAQSSPQSNREQNTENAPELDPVIAQARDVQARKRQALPNFRVRRLTSLFISSTQPIKWMPDAVLTAELSFQGGAEYFEDVKLNGSEISTGTGDLGEHLEPMGKAWSSGEFGSVVSCAFSGHGNVDFHFARREQAGKDELLVYEFKGDGHSPCASVRDHSQIVYPPYRGLAKIDAASKEIVHIEIEATDIPSAFPLDRAERSIDFAPTSIGTPEYTLPTKAFWFGCHRASYQCFMNRIDFQNYRHFESDSSVRFEAPDEHP